MWEAEANRDKIKKVDEDCKKQRDQIIEQGKKIDVMAVQVRAMYEVFTSTNFVLRFVVKTFGAIGVITGAIIGVIELLKRTKS